MILKFRRFALAVLMSFSFLVSTETVVTVFSSESVLSRLIPSETKSNEYINKSRISIKKGEVSSKKMSKLSMQPKRPADF